MGNCLDHREQKVDSSAQRKKTDAPTPDDEVTSETRRERKRDGQITERRQEDEPLTSQSHPNRTGSAVEREAVPSEVEHARDNEEEVPTTQVTNEAAVVRNGTIDDVANTTTKANAESATVHNGGIVENGYHDDDLVAENGVDHKALENGDDKKRWSFPPVLDDFNLMESDIDPSELEAIFADERLKEIELHIKPDSPGLGISIVGGSGSPSGDLPILIKRVLPKSLAEQDGRFKQGDELIAVDDTLLVGMSKDFAINALSNMHGDVRLLVLQEY